MTLATAWLAGVLRRGSSGMQCYGEISILWFQQKITHLQNHSRRFKVKRNETYPKPGSREGRTRIGQDRTGSRSVHDWAEIAEITRRRCKMGQPLLPTRGHTRSNTSTPVRLTPALSHNDRPQTHAVRTLPITCVPSSHSARAGATTSSYLYALPRHVLRWLTMIIIYPLLPSDACAVCNPKQAPLSPTSPSSP